MSVRAAAQEVLDAWEAPIFREDNALLNLMRAQEHKLRFEQAMGQLRLALRYRFPEGRSSAGERGQEQMSIERVRSRLRHLRDEGDLESDVYELLDGLVDVLETHESSLEEIDETLEKHEERLEEVEDRAKVTAGKLEEALQDEEQDDDDGI